MAIKDWLKLKKFSPFHAIAFNTFAQKIKERPVIIFHDTQNNYYYYIKARDAHGDDGELKERFKGEILIKKSNKSNTLFTKDSYLDCSQIFYMQDSELEELAKNHPKAKILNSKELEFDQVEEMFNKIHECLTSKPPFIVISKVSYDSKTEKTKPEVQYVSDWHLNNDYKTIRFKTKKIKELKKQLQKKKSQLRLDLFEGALDDAWGKYRQNKLYNPLFQWIKENEFIQKGLNSMEIIYEYNKLSKPLVPKIIDGETIHTCLVNNRWHDGWDFSLSEKLEATDYNFMIDWFQKNELKINMESFNQFCNAMKKEWPQSDLFDFDELESQLDDELPKLEEKQKQVQNQKTFRDEDTHQNTGLTYEELVQEWEEKWLKKDQDDKFEPPKKKMKM
ncbi:Mbov_0400 family ICE element protein [Mesomycoplasma ovipneumoniae]|uniref:Mbov_0400 family ICE element protein n=1 Tax=Mesomycoplasma ovipneumoniae TaxID=29562 RepID=UPI00311CDC34